MHFDWTINVGTVSALLSILVACMRYGSRVVNYLRGMSLRVDLMWDQFEADHPDVADRYKFHSHRRNGDN